MKLMTFGIALLALLATGCGREEESNQGRGPEMHEEAPPLDFEGLDRDDAALAKAQKTCPVSDEPLGSMGAPVKVETEGRVVFLCCEGCRKKFERDPGKYLAKLGGGGR